jgi:signal transduction histidine kinase
MVLRSLRSRLLLGSILWSLGLLSVAHLIFIAVVWLFPAVLGRGHVFMVAFAAVFLVAGYVLVRGGLSPLEGLRGRLREVGEGTSPRIDGEYPSEVQPLVNDLNAVLSHREAAVSRAVAKAGDLAHGLKTPLALLSREAERIEAEGNESAAGAVREQVERIRRQIDYHLAQARAAASGPAPGTRCVVIESAGGLARTLGVLHAGRGLSIELAVPPGHAVRVEREDLDEMLGNLMDNACNWARSRVVVTSTEEDGEIVLAVEDDGPGLEAAMREAVLRRGVRADENSPGSGLGLSIVRELAELYGGGIVLENSKLGGLCARLRLPRA